MNNIEKVKGQVNPEIKLNHWLEILEEIEQMAKQHALMKGQ